MWLQFDTEAKYHSVQNCDQEEQKPMKKLTALALAFSLSLTLAMGLGATATAIESDGIDVIVNDAAIPMDVPVQVWDQVTYVSYWPVVRPSIPMPPPCGRMTAPSSPPPASPWRSSPV